MSQSSTSLPKPKNWQDFETQMRVLVSCVLGDPNTQQNGRAGQKQSGVDIFGYRNSDCLVGVQCKKKYEKKLTEKELCDEVKKAKTFKPRLSEFILVTTAPRDKYIQEKARLLKEELRQTHHPFIVAVWGWEDIEEQASLNAQAWKAFDPTWNPFVEEGFKKLTLEINGLKEALGCQDARALSSANNPSTIGLNESDENTPLHGQITAFQNLINEGHVRAAFTQLIMLKKDEWSNASRSERFRILVGIASAKLRLGEYAEAGSMLLDAYTECPEHKKALVNKAKGLLLTNNHEEAARIARNILQVDINNADAAGTLIQALLNDDKCLDPLIDLPDELHTVKEVLIAYVHFLRCRNDSAWIEAASASAKRYPDCQLLKQFAAEAVLDQLARSDRDAIAGGNLKYFTANEVNEAAETLYTEAHAAIEKGYALLPSLAHNAALALRFVDDIVRAKEILDAAIEQNPTDQNLKLQRAIIALSENIPKDAIAVLPKKPTEPEAIGVLAQALAASKQYDEALSLIRETDESTLPVHIRAGFLDVRIQAYIASGEKQTAIDLIKQYVATDPENLPLRELLIQTYRNTGDNEAASQSFEEALVLVNDQTSLPSRLLLSFEARKLGRHDEIVNLLKDRVAMDHASEGLRILIASTINSGRWVTAHKILNAVSPELRETEWLQRAEAILAINTGSPTADEKVGSYLKYNPNDLEMILARVGIWQRAGRNSEIGNLLEHLNLEELDGSAELRIQIAATINHYWDARIGLDYGYKVLMNNWDKAKAHLAYQSLILMDENIAETMSSSDVAAENTVVCLFTEDGERRYRIEREKHVFFEDERLTPDVDLARILMGRKPGEKFYLIDRIGSKPVEIRWIKPVYLDAFHLSLNHFNERFPHAEGLLKFTFKPNAEDPFEEIRSITKECTEVHQRMLGVYQEKTLPLSFAASMIGKDPIDAWIGLPTVNVPFQVCRGSLQEREEAFLTIKQNSRKGCIVDAITLSAIRRLGLEKAVSDVCGKIYTTQSVIDLFATRAMEAKLNIGKTQGFLAWRDGQLLYDKQTEENLQRIADDCAKEASWVKEVAVVLPAMPKKDLSQNARSVIKMVGHIACDPAIASDGSELLLLSEDMGFRIWGKAVFNVSSTWLQPVLITARNVGSLSPVEYCEASNSLVLRGHYFTSLDVNCLMHQTIKDNFDLTYELSRLIKAVGGPSADLRTNSGIMSNFIDVVLDVCTDNLKMLKIVSEAFNSITKGRPEDQCLIINLILNQLQSRKKKLISGHALAWLIGHSLGMPYFNDLLRAAKVSPNEGIEVS